MKSGQYVLGYKQTLKMIRQSEPGHPHQQLRKSETEYYARLVKTGAQHYSGKEIELGSMWETLQSMHADYH